MKKKAIYALIVLLMALGGCGTVPVDVPFLFDNSERTVRSLTAEGRFEAAAEKYLRMADGASPPRSHDYRLSAVASYLDAGDPGAAEALLARLDTAPWTTRQKARGHLLTARVALAVQGSEAALASLEKIQSSDCRRKEIQVSSRHPSHCDPALPRPLWPDFFRTRALAYAALGGDEAFQAVRDRIVLDTLLTEASQEASGIEANHRAIWSLLSSLSPAFLSHAYLQPAISSPPPSPRTKTLQGWLTLASIMKEYLSDEASPYSGNLSQALASWRERHPRHPAGRFLLKEFMRIARDKPPSRIALLLPLDGDFSNVARAIHNGFLSAWLKDSEAIGRPTITIRNTVGADIHALYDEVVGAGAEFIVGPLDKPSVALLWKRPNLPAPTLALNHVGETADARPEPHLNQEGPGEIPGRFAGNSGDTGLFQFALTPELEAEQVARRARRDGYARAAILTPGTPWGQRMEGAFRRAWEELGGEVVDTQSFPEDLQEISASVQQLVTNTGVVTDTGGEEPIPEYYKMDCILMAAFPREARQLRPQLRFHYVGNDIPIYATSHVFSGIVDPLLDRDIEGVVFADMPWVLRNLRDETAPASSRDATAPPTLRHVVTTAWPEFAPRYLRYYAFGIDAYRIVPRLAGLRAKSLPGFRGETGELSVDDTGRVRRKLLWARIRGGAPVMLVPPGRTEYNTATETR